MMQVDAWFVVVEGSNEWLGRAGRCGEDEATAMQTSQAAEEPDGLIIDSW